MKVILFAVLAYWLYWSAKAVASWLREAREEKRAEQVADDFLADLDARIAPHLWQQGVAVEDSDEWARFVRGESHG